MNRSARTLVLAALAALAVAGMVLTGCTRSATPVATMPNTVTASGSGTVQAAPDEATMSFGVTKRSQNAKSLLSDTSKAAEKIVAALVKAGVAEKDIQTQNVSFYPQTNYDKGKAVVVGYEASINVNAKVRDLAKLGDIITAVNGAGADSINGPSFSLSEDSPFKTKAIDEAVADARKNAEAMAKAAGKSVGEVVSISDAPLTQVQPYALKYESAASLDSAGAAVPISPGQLDVTSDLTVVFELK